MTDEKGPLITESFAEVLRRVAAERAPAPPAPPAKPEPKKKLLRRSGIAAGHPGAGAAALQLLGTLKRS